MLVEPHASEKGSRVLLGFVCHIAFGHSEMTVMAELQVIPARGGLMSCWIKMSKIDMKKNCGLQAGKGLPETSDKASMRIST